MKIDGFLLGIVLKIDIALYFGGFQRSFRKIERVEKGRRATKKEKEQERGKWNEGKGKEKWEISQ